MARTTFSIDRLVSQAPIERQQRLQLDAEKLGVIAGFLLGLGLGFGQVQDQLLADGLPAWLAGASAVAVVAASTWVGLKAATLAYRLLRSAS